MKVSWIILSHNRLEFVEQAFFHNLLNAGLTSDFEIVWVDNGSTDGTREFAKIRADVLVEFPFNRGVAIGYNTGMLLARGEYIVITGCDMLMPRDWMRTFLDYSTNIKDVVCASMYSVPHERCPERYTGGGRILQDGGFKYVHGLPMGRKMFPRSMLKSVGYLREDFGLYGWEDVEWGKRFLRVANETGKKCIAIDRHIPYHLQRDTERTFAGFDVAAYTNWKAEQVELGKPLYLKCVEANYPYYNPFE